MAETAKERMRRSRQNRRDAGLVRWETFLYAHDLPELKAYAAKLFKKSARNRSFSDER
jgi:hypothetical protein